MNHPSVTVGSIWISNCPNEDYPLVLIDHVWGNRIVAMSHVPGVCTAISCYIVENYTYVGEL